MTTTKKTDQMNRISIRRVDCGNSKALDEHRERRGARGLPGDEVVVAIGVERVDGGFEAVREFVIDAAEFATVDAAIETAVRSPAD